MEAALKIISSNGLQRFRALEAEAAQWVTLRFFPDADLDPEQLDLRQTCQQYFAFHLEFLKPALQFGMLAPMTDYLRWLSQVGAAHTITREQIARSLDWLADYFVARMDAEDGAVVSAALIAARARLMADSDVAAEASCPAPPSPDLEAFLATLIAANHRGALDIVNGCLDAGRGLVDIEANLIKPALYRIGDKWQANEVSVAQEHMATAIAELVMTAALLRSPPPVPNGRKVLLACVAGNRHSVGLRMVADAFQLDGWETQYLGANVPTAALVAQIVESKPDLVGLGLSFGHQLGVVKDVIGQLATRLGGARPPVIIGGLAVNRFDRLAGMVGADATASDAGATVALATRLVTEGENPCTRLAS